MEENNQVNSQIKKEDKKAIGKFVLLMIGSMLVGGVVGFSGMKMVLEMSESGISFTELFGQAKPGLAYVSSYVLIAYTVIMIAVIAWRTIRHQKQLKNWDGEEEETYEKLDKKISFDILLTNVLVLGEYLLFGFVAGDLRGIVVNHGILWLVVLLFYLSAMIGQIVLQQKIINRYKEVNPEKKGSVYDMHFRKKWYESCDEAEQAAIGKAAVRAINAVNGTCVVLEVLLIAMNMLLNVGIMAHIAVMIIWSVANISYVIAGNKISYKI